MESALNRFLGYVKMDTTSKENQDTYPSTPAQLELAAMLAKELKELGALDAGVDEYGYVTATIPSNVNDKVPVIGLIAHMDTSDAVSGADIKPVMIDYEGGDILLNKEKNIVMEEAKFPQLKRYVGQKLIVTDGTTLLGADDKAGVAEIMTAVEYFMNHPEVPHGTIRIAFTPDEEVGEGTRFFNVEKFGAEYAYTVDGGALGGIEYENFNAASASVKIHGASIHPGSSKNKMKNALLMAMELNSMLPPAEIPAHTEGYEGFYHLDSLSGEVEEAQMHYIIRDHDRAKFEARKQTMEKVTAYLNEKYGEGTFELEQHDGYYNMVEVLKNHMHLIDRACDAFTACGITPAKEPVRGGTDGARLSYKGLPCPNLSTGGENFHGKYEFIPVDALQSMVEVLVKLVSGFANEK